MESNDIQSSSDDFPTLQSRYYKYRAGWGEVGIRGRDLPTYSEVSPRHNNPGTHLYIVSVKKGSWQKKKNFPLDGSEEETLVKAPLKRRVSKQSTAQSQVLQ